MPAKPVDRPPEPMAEQLRHLEPQQQGEDDRLEPPGVDMRRVLLAGVGMVVFLGVSLSLLAAFMRLEVGDFKWPPLHSFPVPRLETNIDPRTLPSILPGPAAPPYPQPPPPPAHDAADLQRAMQIVAAKGARAYDPLSPPGVEPAPRPNPAPDGAFRPPIPQAEQGTIGSDPSGWTSPKPYLGAPYPAPAPSPSPPPAGSTP